MSKWAVSICPSGHFYSYSFYLKVVRAFGSLRKRGSRGHLTHSQRSKKWSPTRKGPGYARLSISDGYHYKRLRRCKDSKRKKICCSGDCSSSPVYFFFFLLKKTGERRQDDKSYEDNSIRLRYLCRKEWDTLGGACTGSFSRCVGLLSELNGPGGGAGTCKMEERKIIAVMCVCFAMPTRSSPDPFFSPTMLLMPVPPPFPPPSSCDNTPPPCLTLAASKRQKQGRRGGMKRDPATSIRQNITITAGKKDSRY